LGRSNGGDPKIWVDDQVTFGISVQSPYLAIANRQTEIMMRIASEFGFTPASQSRISTSVADEPTLFDLMEEEVIDEEAEAGKQV
jgi:phage terminase small subunit